MPDASPTTMPSKKKPRKIKARLLQADDLLRAHPVAAYGFLRLDAEDEAAVAVIKIVARAASYPPELVQYNYPLTDLPLNLKTAGLHYVAEWLTRYVRSKTSEADVTVQELSAPGLLIGALITLVKKKIS